MTRTKMLIDGVWVVGEGDAIEVRNPARGSVVGTVSHATPAEVDLALRAARLAFGDWSKRPPVERARLLKRAAHIIRERKSDLGRLMTSEQGKPVNEAVGEISKLADTFDFYAEEATRVFGEIIPNDSNAYQSLVVREPIGVVAAISPWNYPAELIGWKVAAGLTAGCTLVVKPPELTPLSPLAIMECMVDAGLPAGTINMVTGKGSTVGQQMVESDIPDKIAFTGSSAVGLHIQQSLKNIKRLSLELGGNCPMIVTAQANLDQAVKGAARRSFRNCGQICIAINRIYVERAAYEPFLEKLAAAADSLVVDDGLENPDADLGALCSQEPLDKTKQHLADALERGARLVAGGRAPDAPGLENGLFFRPTVVADCSHDMKVMTEETFGPLVGVTAFDKHAEAVRMANDTPYGLASYLYTKNMDEMRYYSRHLDYGNVAVNNVDAGIISAPYGGWKQSGIGVEHAREGLLEYLNYKHVRLCFDEDALQ
ncbi:aldehyde dehydrogenase family protein [Hoeflea prorocentri]|uniref:NAD-dependent succinate-semialdehyde dehydrogenase n=1 Tax=Hoeflea prorocentri TaxID=1922333 RepID=A0A9X3UF76_9HYPH|nr:NAD-dependent succinate-semialdehyde dehydrogenase [Hoeflea prorocentri]MCY6379780.1 NAD-dependent succinate-semialdehyde dehydrogenase [Hoeflea prorocentri]MDA5397580.1 NAD-dependent succinate-semialdehyde dehydrogenase [Hoeflea prorocentri]